MLRPAPMRLALLIWLLLSIALLIAYAPAITTLTTTDPDDALRLVQVRDLIGGQAWWDVSQHRINPAGGGGLMHWSRIVDAPLALGIVGLTPLTGEALATRIVMAVWPLLLLGATMAALARMTASLGQHGLVPVALLLLASDFVILYQFTPLRIDHHGWQILLTLCALAMLMRLPDARSGILAGAAAAVLLAISLEGLPAAALFAGLIALEWLWTGTAAARARLNAYLWTLFGGAILLQFVTRGPDALVQRWCDALSLPWLGALGVAALGVTLGSWLVDRREWRRIGRLVLLAAVGACSGAMLLAVEPLCLKGPFGTLDPLVQTYWFDHVREGLPLWRPFDALAGFSFAPALVGLAGCWLGWRAAETADIARRWLWLGAGLAGLTVVSLLVLRAGSTAHVVAMPGCAMLALTLWRWARALERPLPRIAATLATIVAVPPVSGALAASLSASPTVGANAAINSRPCIAEGQIGALGTMPPHLLLTPLDIGPGLLQHSHHAVVATGHHRNNAAMAGVIRLFTGPVDEAEALARASGAQMIVICPGAPEWRNFRNAPGEGLADVLSDGAAPNWLEPVPLGENVPLRAWRIVGSAPPRT